ncbi:MAG: VanZ family protein [Bacilli bacterium]|nr:VanZ family protein [Bacilli bacterium]
MSKNKISLLLVILWMIFIFVMSSFDATSSSNQSNFIVDIITSIINIKDIGLLSLIIRKLAHFIEYFILGILVINFITRYDKKIIIAILLCIIYATSDEIHQIFVPGRSCQIIDIMIDSLGAIMGIYLYKLITKKCKK